MSNEQYFLTEQDIDSFDEFINLSEENSDNSKLKLAKLKGIIMGSLSFLKSYAINNNLNL